LAVVDAARVAAVAYLRIGFEAGRAQNRRFAVHAAILLVGFGGASQKLRAKPRATTLHDGHLRAVPPGGQVRKGKQAQPHQTAVLEPRLVAVRCAATAVAKRKGSR
jgi:hypothetical protein